MSQKTELGKKKILWIIIKKYFFEVRKDRKCSKNYAPRRTDWVLESGYKNKQKTLHKTRKQNPKPLKQNTTRSMCVQKKKKIPYMWKKTNPSQVWLPFCNPSSQKVRQEDCGFKARTGYTVRSSHKKKIRLLNSSLFTNSASTRQGHFRDSIQEEVTSSKNNDNL